MSLISVIAIIVLVAVGTTLYLRKQHDKGTPLSSVEEQNLGRYYDWNWSQSPESVELRKQVCERLGEMGPGDRFLLRLAKEANLSVDEPSVATVNLKDGIYWSDSRQVVAEQVVDAYLRIQDGSKRGIWKAPTAQQESWLRGLKISAEGRLTLKIEGIKDQADLEALLASDMLIPIRKDLLVPPADEADERIDAAGASDQAWLVTTGRYRLAALPAKKGSAVLKLEPNPLYYRGPASQGTTLKID
jgi:ABC-type transport system substrate-binding protein